jgi:hypothetical protein
MHDLVMERGTLLTQIFMKQIIWETYLEIFSSKIVQRLLIIAWIRNTFIQLSMIRFMVNRISKRIKTVS